MNDNFADDLVIPAIEQVQHLMEAGEFDGALLWADEDIRLQLDDYWAEINDEPAMDMAEKATATLLHDSRRWVFVTPVSYQIVEESGQFNVSHVDVFDPKLIWALCYEEGVGYDICAMFYVQRPNGTFAFDVDITMLAGEQQMLDGAPGFTLLKSILEVA